MTPAQRHKRIVKVFTAYEDTYVADHDLLREDDLGDEAVAQIKTALDAGHRALRELRISVEGKVGT